MKFTSFFSGRHTQLRIPKATIKASCGCLIFFDLLVYEMIAFQDYFVILSGLRIPKATIKASCGCLIFF